MAVARAVTGLVVDLDNTLYDFDRYFTSSIRALIHAVSRHTGIPEATLESDVREVIAKRKLLEYAFLLQELRSIQKSATSAAEMSEVIRVGRGAFRRAREANLKLYPGVRETLKWLRAEGIVVVALSDAPFFQAEGRLRFFNITTYFAALRSWEGVRVPHFASSVTKDYNHKTDVGKFRAGQRKPNDDVLRSIMKEFDLVPARTFVVGDSVHRDIALAATAGVKSIWAEYGTKLDRKTKETLRRVSPHQKERDLAESQARKELRPDYRISAFREIRGIVGSQRLLF